MCHINRLARSENLPYLRNQPPTCSELSCQNSFRCYAILERNGIPVSLEVKHNMNTHYNTRHQPQQNYWQIEKGNIKLDVRFFKRLILVHKVFCLCLCEGTGNLKADRKSGALFFTTLRLLHTILAG